MADERTRKNEAQILQALARSGQKPVSELLSVSESTISRMKEGEIARFAKLLAALELKVVPVEMKCYPRKTITAIFTLAQQHLNSVDGAQGLIWED